MIERWRLSRWPTQLASLLAMFALVYHMVCVDVATAASAEPVQLQIGSPPEGTVPEEGKTKDPMQDLLYWAVQHSDPEKLKEMMLKYKENNLTLKDVYGQELIDAFFRDEATVMMRQVAMIRDFRNASLPEGDLMDALEGLEENLHQIDNAGNLHKMGGMEPLLELSLGVERSDETRSLALWALGVAVQNNPPVQMELNVLGGLRRLVGHLAHCKPDAQSKVETTQFCSKLLFTLSGMVKNEASLQVEADNLGMMDWLLDVGIGHKSLAVAKKALGTLETVLAQSSEAPLLDRLPQKRHEIAATLFARVRGEGEIESDTDVSEKVFALINRLLALRPALFLPVPRFREDLASTLQVAKQRCETHLGTGDEICTVLSDLVSQADRILAASHVSDDEL